MAREDGICYCRKNPCVCGDIEAEVVGEHAVPEREFYPRG